MATEIIDVWDSSSSSCYTLNRIHAALAGEFDAGLLSASERDYFDDMVGAVLDTPKGAGRIFWERFDRSVNTDR